MARNYGKIETGFWTNANTRRLSENAQRLLLYIFTCRHGTGASAYVLPLGYVIADLDWPISRVAAAFDELSLKPHVLRDAQTSVIYVPGWWEHNQPENPRVAAFLAKHLLALPNCRLKATAIHAFLDSGYRTVAVKEAIGDWKYTESQGALAFSVKDEGQHALFDETPQEPAQPVAKEKKKREATFLEAEWLPPEEYSDYARKQGMSDERIEKIALKFVRYWTRENRSSKKDWYATWQNWIDKEAERSPAPNGGGGNGSAPAAFVIQDKDVMWTARLAAYDKTGFWPDIWGPKPGQPDYEGPKPKRAPPPPP